MFNIYCGSQAFRGLLFQGEIMTNDLSKVYD